MPKFEKGHIVSDKERERISKLHKGKKHTKEHNAKIALSHIGIKPNQETRGKLSKIHKGHNYWVGRKHKQESKDKMSKSKKGMQIGLGRHYDDAFCKKQSEIHKNLWKDPEYAARILKHRCQHPNKKEAILENILNELFPNQYKFTGDGSFSIYNLHPDFTNSNGQKKCVELYGNYWHNGENPQDRIDKFAAFGYSCIVIWESELKDIETVKNRLIVFNNHLAEVGVEKYEAIIN